MGRIGKLKREAINEANVRVLNEQQVKPKYDSPQERISFIKEIVWSIADMVDDIRYEESKEPGERDVNELRSLQYGKERAEKLVLSKEKEMGIPEGTILKNMMEDIENGDGRLTLTWKYLEDWVENQKG